MTARLIMSVLAGLAAFAWRPVQAGEPVAEPSATGKATQRVRSLAVRARPVVEWKSEAELRMPEREFRTAGDGSRAREPDELHGLAELEHVGDDRWSLSLVLSDGRAFLRTVDVHGENPARELISSLENLLAAIEGDEVLPDQEGVELVENAPVAMPMPPKPPDPPKRAEPKSSPTAGLAVWLAGGTAFGLSPSSNALRGGGGEVGLDLRFVNGLTLRTGFRVIGANRLARLRWSLGTGYTLRRARFELPTIVFISLEGWRVQESGGALSVIEREPGHSQLPVFFVVDSQGDAARTPLLGAGIAIEPRLRFEARRRLLRSFFVGLRVEASASGMPPQMAAFTVRREAGHAAFTTAGGIEAALAVTVGATFGRR